MKKLLLTLAIVTVSQTSFAAEQLYTLDRSRTSTGRCFDFIFGLSNSTQFLIKTVKIIANKDGIAIGFDTKEIGDVSDLKTKLKVIAPATYQVLKGKSYESKFTTGLAGYVHWNVKLTQKIKKQRTLTSISREGFGTGSESEESCTLIQQ